MLPNAANAVESFGLFHMLSPTAKVLTATGLGNATSDPQSSALNDTEAQNYVHESMLNANQSFNGTLGYNEGNFYKDLFIVFSYSLISIVSLFGNALVLRVVFSRKKATFTESLIASLAVADLLTGVYSIPLNVTRYIATTSAVPLLTSYANVFFVIAPIQRFIALNYPFGSLFCTLVPLIQVGTVYVSTLSMAVIAFHRYRTLSCPHRTYISTNGPLSTRKGGINLLGGSCRLVLIIGTVWCVAGLFAVPHSIWNEIVYVTYRNISYARCRAEYPDHPRIDYPFWLSVEGK